MSNMSTTRVVRDLMTHEVFSLREDQNLQVLKEFMDWRNIRHIPITDESSRIVGLISHRDVLGLAISKLADVDRKEVEHLYATITIGSIMNRDVETVSADLPLSEAAGIMVSHKYGCLPVTEDGKLVGIITEADFVKAFVDCKVTF